MASDEKRAESMLMRIVCNQVQRDDLGSTASVMAKSARRRTKGGSAIAEWGIVVCTAGLERAKQEAIALNGILEVMQSRVV
jgi:hypothetical protein